MSDPSPYLTPEWKALRKRVIAEQPICAACLMKPSSCADHKIAWKGDMRLFWDRSNLQGYCWSCHSAKTVKRDGGWGKAPSGRPLRGTDAGGEPTDPDHHWFRE